MNTLLWIFISTLIISLLAFAGIFTLAVKEKLLEKVLLSLVALSAGALMGGAFFHLLPEAIKEFGDPNVFVWVSFAFVFFFLVEKLLHWRHCHKGKCEIHSFGYMNLFGDSVHNFIDGLIIAATFLVDINLGIVTAIAIGLHEVPQEIGDFGVLVYAGFKKKKALILNFLVASTVILGGIVGFFLAEQIAGSIQFLIPFAAGGFIYIAASDLLPEVRKEKNLVKSLTSFGVFVIGFVIMYLVKFIGVE